MRVIRISEFCSCCKCTSSTVASLQKLWKVKKSDKSLGTSQIVILQMSWLFAAVVAPTSLRFHVSSDGSQRQWKIERPIQQLGETFPRISQVLHVWTIWIWGKGWSKGKGGKGGKGQGFGKAAQKAGGKSGTQTKGKNNGGWGNGYRAAPNDFGCVLDLNYGLEDVLRLGGADSDHDRKRFIQKLAHTRGCWSCNVFFHLHLHRLICFIQLYSLYSFCSFCSSFAEHLSSWSPWPRNLCWWKALGRLLGWSQWPRCQGDPRRLRKLKTVSFFVLSTWTCDFVPHQSFPGFAGTHFGCRKAATFRKSTSTACSCLYPWLDEDWLASFTTLVADVSESIGWPSKACERCSGICGLRKVRCFLLLPPQALLNFHPSRPEVLRNKLWRPWRSE